jgi:NAD(P)-dependent dehydrogenase (short-subunit alcohol dehydrogenase family)
MRGDPEPQVPQARGHDHRGLRRHVHGERARHVPGVPRGGEPHPGKQRRPHRDVVVFHHGHTLLPRYAAYTATNGAVEAMTRILANEVAVKGITANVMEGWGVPHEEGGGETTDLAL